jgi:hypothetical protein
MLDDHTVDTSELNAKRYALKGRKVELAPKGPKKKSRS